MTLVSFNIIFLESQSMPEIIDFRHVLFKIDYHFFVQMDFNDMSTVIFNKIKSLSP